MDNLNKRDIMINKLLIGIWSLEKFNFGFNVKFIYEIWVFFVNLYNKVYLNKNRLDERVFNIKYFKLVLVFCLDFFFWVIKIKRERVDNLIVK